MPQPGLPSSVAPDQDWFVRQLQDLQRQIKELAAANPFAPMGIHPLAGATQFDGNVIANGDITSNGELTANGLTVNGAAVIAGTLSLPAGIINNAALQSPLSPLSQHAGTNNFSLSTGPNVPLLTTTINVPAGYTQAQVTALGVVHAYNPNTSPDDFYAVVTIGGVQVGASSQSTVAAGQDNTIAANAVKTLSGLGSSFDVAVLGSSGSLAWAANSVNFVNLDVSVTFLR
jgi:hypothetical protein